ncbi:MAG: M23 family metallopeptidase [Pseudomonadota bacterium]
MPFRLVPLLSFFVAIAISAAAHAVDIGTAPGAPVYFHRANPNKGYNDLMLQTVVLRNTTDAAVTLKSLRIDVLAEDGDAAVSKTMSARSVLQQTRRFAAMEAQGLGVFLDLQVLTEGGLKKFSGADATLASEEDMAPGAAMILSSQYFTVDFEPASVRISAAYEDGSGHVTQKTHHLPVAEHEIWDGYVAPLKGGWSKKSAPGVHSHHRFIPSNEFAVDFFQTGPEGVLDRGEKRSAEDDFGYGAPVYAVADGEVVFAINGEVQDPDALSRREGESIEEARARITQNQFRRFAENFRAAAAGNMITIKHDLGDGRIEYSSYAHLKSDSVRVGVGDKIRQGDIIAEVGNTGDSTLTHLHFQINAGPDAFFSRSLPFAFNNEKTRYIGQELGIFVTFGE